jgi:endonuclease/exonuclease/phosphatase (EEP) superfamily protein YafD
LPVSLPIAIDHVLVGDAYDVLARRTFTIPGSDHRGVCAELALR